MKGLSPKSLFLTLIIMLALSAVSDHLASPTSPAIASQSAGAKTCAPCGAPCTLTEK